MTKRLPVTPTPSPLEGYAAQFDELFGARAQRNSFRRYLEGLLLPAERNKTLTALANTEPVAGAQHKGAQSLQWFLSESGWDPDIVNERRLGLLQSTVPRYRHTFFPLPTKNWLSTPHQARVEAPGRAAGVPVGVV